MLNLSKARRLGLARREAKRIGAEWHREGPYLVLATGMGPQGLRFGQIHENDHPSLMGRAMIDALPAMRAVK